MKEFGGFLQFLEIYFRGPTGLAEYREMFLCKGDPRSGRVKDRGGVWVGGLDTYVSTFIKSLRSLREWNIFMGVGYWVEHGVHEPILDKMLYDRLSFDFDNEESPLSAVAEALGFASFLYKNHGVKPLVFETGFKGAHVIVPLSRPVKWESYHLLWRNFYDNMPPVTRKMIDLNMLQWNRVDRVPLTYNVKEEGRRFCKIIYPQRVHVEGF